MQTIEPAFDQLIRIQVLGSYHVVAADKWQVALHRHSSYVPERKLLSDSAPKSIESARDVCAALLEKAGIPRAHATQLSEQASSARHFYQLQRAARIIEAMKQEEVLPHVAAATVRRAIDLGIDRSDGLEALNWCEIALEICRYKRTAGQMLRNLPGLLISIARDPETQKRLVTAEVADRYKKQFEDAERMALQMAEREEERNLIHEYERYRQQLARNLLDGMSEADRNALFDEKMAALRQQGRLAKIPPESRRAELEQHILHDLIKKEAAPFERWRLRTRARQASLPFTEQNADLSRA
jgi:hypothetical protein